MKCPCKGCTDRKLGCHGMCRKYQEWKKEHDDKMNWLSFQHKPIGSEDKQRMFDQKMRRKARGYVVRDGGRYE